MEIREESVIRELISKLRDPRSRAYSSDADYAAAVDYGRVK